MTEEQKTEKRAAQRKWHPPTSGFLGWWEPDGHNPQTGAQTGGHRDALRKCVRPETREIRYYGIEAMLAFNTREYREEYLQWLRDGQPPKADDYDGTAAPMANVRKCMDGIRSILSGSTLLSGAEKEAMEILQHRQRPASPFQQVKNTMEGSA